MSQRKEVFQSKVLQKLYPPPPRRQEDDQNQRPKPPESKPPPEPTNKKRHVKRTSPQEDTGRGRPQSESNAGRRLYGAPLPPADYQPLSLEAAASQIETIQQEAEGSEVSDEEEEEEEHKRRKRRRRKKAVVSEAGAGRTGTPADEEGERVSRNKKRKMKKKRHREKLRSLGLKPRNAAVDFTFLREAEEEEEEEEKRGAEASESTGRDVEISVRARPAADLWEDAAEDPTRRPEPQFPGSRSRNPGIGRPSRGGKDLESSPPTQTSSDMFFRVPRLTPGYIRLLQTQAYHNMAVSSRSDPTVPGMAAVLLGAVGVGLCGYSSRQLALHHRPSARVLLWVGAVGSHTDARAGAAPWTPAARQDIPPPAFVGQKVL